MAQWSGHWLLLKRIWVQFPPPTWQRPVICNSSSNAQFWSLLTQGNQVVHGPTCSHSTHTHKIKTLRKIIKPELNNEVEVISGWTENAGYMSPCSRSRAGNKQAEEKPRMRNSENKHHFRTKSGIYWPTQQTKRQCTLKAVRTRGLTLKTGRLLFQDRQKVRT